MIEPAPRAADRYARRLPRLIGPAILAWFLATTDLGRIAAHLRGVHWIPLVVALALYPIFIALKAWRWRLLVGELRLAPPSPGDAMVLYMIGLFAAAATPGQSGDFIKAWYLRARGQPMAPALFSVLLDRLFDLLVMAVLSVLGLVAFRQLAPPRLAGLVAAVAIAVAAALVAAVPALVARRPRERLIGLVRRAAPRRAGAALERWRGQLTGMGLRPARLGIVLAVTLAAITVTMARLWLLFAALEINIPLLALVSAMALVAIAQTLPISVAGLGVRDAILIAVLAAYGYAAAAALALSALILLLNLENIAIGFVVSLRHPLGRATAAEPPRAEAVPTP
ncbi:MAG TPA: lysylphosphatidylglycerol synthase transmembrane domain-containing protein [Gemmatimonadales bacterium]|nr:lysylphosphatidylglycerol synthase transmembrane domain-containing protein [Gemmatimonadales bacterium]